MVAIAASLAWALISFRLPDFRGNRRNNPLPGSHRQEIRFRKNHLHFQPAFGAGKAPDRRPDFLPELDKDPA